MRKLLVLLSLLLLLWSHSLGARESINFAPLPLKKGVQNIEDFLPLSHYLKEKLGIETNFIHIVDYADIIKGFQNGSIDIAYLGPLPLIYLNQNYQYATPIVTFKQKNGDSHYRCVLVKFKEDKIKRQKPLRVALTQPLSTCGFYMTNLLLKEQFAIDLSKQYYHYTMSHDNALLRTLEGQFVIAGAKDSIAKKYATLGMEIIAQSRPIPGFSLVVNRKTLSKKQIDTLQKTLLSIPKERYREWGGITSKGMIESSVEEYESLEVDFDTIPKEGNVP